MLISTEPLLQRLEPLHPVPTDAVPNVPRLDGIRIVLFDIYGTLLVSSSGDIDVRTFVAEGISECFEQARCRVLADDRLAFGEQVIGAYKRTIEEHHAAAKAAGDQWPEVDIRQVWRDVLGLLQTAGAVAGASDVDVDVLAILFENLMNPVYPMPGMPSVVARLHEAGVLLGVVSNAQFFTPILMNYFLEKPAVEDKLSAPFDPELVAFSYQYRIAKPAPALFEAARASVEARGGRAEEVLFVGNDMLNDIWGAAQVGFRTGLFAGDRRSLRFRSDSPEVRDLKPDCVVTELSQLLTVLGLEE